MRAWLRALAGLSLGAALWVGCSEPAPPDAGVVPDAAAPLPVFEDPQTQTRFSWPHTWSRASAPTRADDDGVVILAKVLRVPTTHRVPARIELTLEPTTLEEQDLAARRVKNVLEAQLEAAGAKVRRVSLSKRAVQGRLLGVLDLTYAVSAGTREPTLVRHRSLIALGPFGQATLAILTLTATYVAQDHDLVGPEVDAVFESLTLPLPPAPAPDRTEPTPK